MIKNKIVVVITGLLLSCSLHAQESLSIPSNQSACFRFSNLKGASSDAKENYTFRVDNFPNKHFDFIIDGNSNVQTLDKDEAELKFSVIGSSIIGVYLGNNNEQNLETWTMDLENKKVIFNRTRIGFPTLNGTGSYIGDIEKCTPAK